MYIGKIFGRASLMLNGEFDKEKNQKTILDTVERLHRCTEINKDPHDRVIAGKNKVNDHRPIQLVSKLAVENIHTEFLNLDSNDKFKEYTAKLDFCQNEIRRIDSKDSIARSDVFTLLAMDDYMREFVKVNRGVLNNLVITHKDYLKTNLALQQLTLSQYQKSFLPLLKATQLPNVTPLSNEKLADKTLLKDEIALNDGISLVSMLGRYNISIGGGINYAPYDGCKNNYERICNDNGAYVEEWEHPSGYGTRSHGSGQVYDIGLMKQAASSLATDNTGLNGVELSLSNLAPRKRSNSNNEETKIAYTQISNNDDDDNSDVES